MGSVALEQKLTDEFQTKHLNLSIYPSIYLSFIYVSIYLLKDIYYKELFHMIVEAEKSQDL